MSDIHTDKKNFVSNELFNIVKKIDSTVEKMSYSTSYGEESVLIGFKSGFTINCNVTGDSLKALAIDVL